MRDWMNTSRQTRISRFPVVTTTYSDGPLSDSCALYIDREVMVGAALRAAHLEAAVSGCRKVAENEYGSKLSAVYSKTPPRVARRGDA
jgi:hypothetical protein